jgi:transketolase
MHTAKPLDDEAVAKAATETGAIVVAEEHLLRGGLGSAVAMSVAKQHPVPMRFVGIDDTYAESGIGTDVLKKYGLTSSDITQTAKELVG